MPAPPSRIHDRTSKRMRRVIAVSPPNEIDSRQLGQIRQEAWPAAQKPCDVLPQHPTNLRTHRRRRRIPPPIAWLAQFAKQPACVGTDRRSVALARQANIADDASSRRCERQPCLTSSDRPP